MIAILTIRSRAVVVRFAVPPVSDPGPSSFSLRSPQSPSSPRGITRPVFPGKALADIGGRPMIEHVYRRAAAARSIASVIVATDDERIADAVRAFGGEARHDVAGASERHRSARRSRRVARLRPDRQRPGRRAAASSPR